MCRKHLEIVRKDCTDRLLARVFVLAWFWSCKSSSATCKHQGTQLLHALRLWHSALTKMAISHWQQNSRSDHSALLHKGSVALYLLTLKPGQQTRELIRLWRLKTAGSLALQTALQTVNRTQPELSCSVICNGLQVRQTVIGQRLRNALAQQYCTSAESSLTKGIHSDTLQVHM